MIREEARILSFVVRESQQGSIADLDLPAPSRVVCVYRQDKFLLPDENFDLKVDDEVVMITNRDSVEKFAEFVRRPD